jgi:hypothetical protein
MEAAGIEISLKDLRQYRVMAHGAAIMRHCVAVIRIKYGPQEQE